MIATPRLDDEDDRKSVVLSGLRVEFLWVEDRWSHALKVGEDRRIVLSVEGGDDPSRVVSPAYQQFHWHEDGGEAMLIGQSGPHTFSAVFRLSASEAGAVLSVDLADRCREPVNALACTYVADLNSGNLDSADSASIVWSLGEPAGRLSLDSEGSTTLSLAEAGRRGTQVQALGAIDPEALTHRLAYRWSWTRS